MRIVLALLLSLASCLGQNLIDSYRYAAATTPLTTNLVSYYKMDETGDGTQDLVDIHAGKTFTRTGGSLNSVSGIIGTARNSTGGSPYATRADDTSFEPGSSPFFVTMWIKPNSLTQDNIAVFSKWNSSGTQGEWCLTFYNTGHLYLDVSSNGGSTSTSVGINTLFTDTTTAKFVAFGWDGTNTKMSVNGGAFVTAAFAGPIFSGTANVLFWGRNNGAWTAFSGMIDEAAFWKGRSLTITEVQTIYNSGAGKAYTTW